MKFILFFILLTSQTFAQVDNEIGVGVHECSNKIELYDFFEGRHPLAHGIETWSVDSRLSADDYIQKAMERIRFYFPDIYPRVQTELEGIFKFKEDEYILNFNLPVLQNEDIAFVENDCRFKQVASWNDRFNRIIISKKLFEKLNSMDKAGIYLHLAMSSVAKKSLIPKNQDNLRKITAKVFSDQDLTPEDGEIIYSRSKITMYQSPRCTNSVKGYSDFTKILISGIKLCGKYKNTPDYETVKAQVKVITDHMNDNLNTCLQYCVDPEALEFCQSTKDKFMKNDFCLTSSPKNN